VAWQVRRDGLEVAIELDASSYSPETAAAVRSAIRAAHPEVDQMIVSGLVGDIEVEPTSFASRGAQRSTVFMS